MFYRILFHGMKSGDTRLLVADFLLGLHGKDKFSKYWYLVKNGLQESDVINTNLVNFKRGHLYEQEAINYFENI